MGADVRGRAPSAVVVPADRLPARLANNGRSFVYFLLLLLSVAVVLRVRSGAPPWPVTVNGNVPRAVEELTVIVNAEEVVVVGFGLKLPAAPAGRPFTDKLTDAVNPPVRVIVTV